MVFLTHNNLMISEEFLSSFPIDATDFDESKVASIVKGKTTRQEVVALLGKPNGNGVFPFVKNKGETALIYSYSHAKGSAFNMTFFSKILVVTVGDDGIVSEVEYSSSGEK
jgi:hypothetical protein